jgi:hypothetical protein
MEYCFLYISGMHGRSAREWQEKAESCRTRAALYRRAVERAEGPGGFANDPRWFEIRGILLELADEFEREAAEADARAESATRLP